MRNETKERLVRAIKDLYFTTGEKWIDSHYKIGSVGEEGAGRFQALVEAAYKDKV